METLRWNKTGEMMRGIAVQRFQEFGEQVVSDINWLETNGGRFGNDGWFGEDSHNLALLVQKKLGLVEDGIVGPATWTAIFKALDIADPNAPKEYERDGIKVIDGRGIWTPVKKYFGVNRAWTGDGKNVVRGVMLHQTGCYMPESYDVWRKINAHCGVTRKGTVILMFPFEMLIWHGNGLTRPTIGIEIAGLLRGVEGRSNTHWPPSATPNELLDIQVKAANVLLTIIEEEFAKQGGRWQVIYAHRQSSNMRMSDPGEAVWKRIGLPWLERTGATCGGIPELGSSSAHDEYCVGNGMPIPAEWNDGNAHRFWG